MSPRVRHVLFGALVMGGGLAIWGFDVEPNRLSVQRASVAPAAWPASLQGLTVAVLADLHVGSPHHDLDRLRGIVARTNALEPDLVLLAGDYVIQGVLGGDFVPPEDAAAVLATLQAPLGVFGVLGNHDAWLDADRVTRAFEEAGIPMLDNRARLVEAPVGAFWLAGFGDYWTGDPDIPGTLAQTDGAAPVLAFTHNPDVFPDVPEGVALTIAGHTHGGQVRVPLWGPPIVPSEFGQRYAAGVVEEEGRLLFVATGTGTSILPVRFGVPPRIGLVTLRAGGS